MAFRPTSIDDLELRQRWNLADDDPGPISLPKMQLPKGEARRLDEARWQTLDYRPERDGYGEVVNYGAELGGQEGADDLSGRAGGDAIVGTGSDTRHSGKRGATVPASRSLFIVPEGKYSPGVNLLGSLTTGSPSQSKAPFRYKSVAELHGFDKAPNPAQVYSDGRRNYPTAAAAEAASRDRPQFRNPPDPKADYEARRGKAFLDSIGAGAFGLGPMSYVMGGSPEAVQASTQFDEALGGLAAGVGMRPAGRARLPTPRAETPLLENKEWPGNGGFLYSLPKVLPRGTRIDRYGEEERKDGTGGNYTAPFGTPFEARAVGYRPEHYPYHAYEVVEPIPVRAGPAVPWKGQPGGGWQFEHPKSVKALRTDDKTIRRLTRRD